MQNFNFSYSGLMGAKEKSDLFFEKFWKYFHSDVKEWWNIFCLKDILLGNVLNTHIIGITLQKKAFLWLWKFPTHITIFIVRNVSCVHFFGGPETIRAYLQHFWCNMLQNISKTYQNLMDSLTFCYLQKCSRRFHDMFAGLSLFWGIIFTHIN